MVLLGRIRNFILSCRTTQKRMMASGCRYSILFFALTALSRSNLSVTSGVEVVKTA